MRQKDIATTIVANANETDLTLHGLGTWTLHDTLSEQDVHLPGKISTHLSLHNNRLVGTIENTLPTPLYDLYVLFPTHFVSLGQLAPGEARQVDLPLIDAPLSSETSLVDYLAKSGGLAENYFPYLSRQHPQTDFQRHMALLSALNGIGSAFAPCHGSCKTQAITDKETIYYTEGRVPNPGMNTDNPLLIPGASATLIGWAEQSLSSGVTVNGWHPIGRQESLLQVPVALDLAKSRNFPSNIVMGHVVNVQSYDAELRLSGIYAMITGNITFEMTVPNSPRQPIHELTVTQPDLWAHPFGPGSGLLTSHLQALLYNWQTASWETIPLQQDTFSTSHPAPYIGPQGQVLLQVLNKDNSQGSLYFGVPSLSVK